jgi:hypothetical protein
MTGRYDHGYGLSVAMAQSSLKGASMFGPSCNRFNPIRDRFWSNRIDFVGLADFLRRRHPVKTAASVASETGLPADSVKKWLSGEVQPNGRSVFALICAYGPSLISASVKGAPEWCDTEARAAKIAALKAELADLEK